ncbi:MAG: EF-hand domain-containing protein [Burkholderiaceae bacterium]|nr:EF-hand domain-containing protein [Burkholderiaceae bacterium]
MMFNKRLLSVAFAFALVAISGVSTAQTIDPATQAKLTELEARFKVADKNADGKLTLQEAKDGMPRVADAFSHIDIDKKGYVTLEQIRAVMIKSGG